MPVIDKLPTGAVFSVENAAAPRCCGIPQLPNRVSPNLAAMYRGKYIPEPFLKSDVNRGLHFAEGKKNPRTGQWTLPTPVGFKPSDMRGHAVWQLGDETRWGSFWKRGGGKGVTGLGCSKTTPACCADKPGINVGIPIPIPIAEYPASNLVDTPKAFATGEYMNYDQGWPYPRSLL